MASALAQAWSREHDLLIGGRSREKARATADRIGAAVRAAAPADVVERADVVVVAVAGKG